MSPYSALAFAAIGLALLALPSRRMQPLVRPISAWVLAVGAINLLGYVWSASGLVGNELAPPVAVHTAFAFFVLGSGTWMASQARSGLPEPTRESIGRKVATGFLAALLLLVIGGGITYRNSMEFVHSSERVAHTQDIRVRLGRLYGAVADADAAARAYLLTGALRHQAAYAGFAAESRHQLAALGGMLVDPSMQPLHARMRELVGRHLDELQRTAGGADSGASRAARVMMAPDREASLMDALRALTREMDNAEAGLLARREARARGDRQDALLFLIFTLICAGGIFAVLLRNIRHEMLARADADESVRRLNAELERRVEERTAQLEENQRRFVDLFEFSPDALVMVDRQGTIVQVNRQTEALFGWTRGELAGQPVKVLLPASHASPSRPAARALPAVGAAPPDEGRAPRPARTAQGRHGVSGRHQPEPARSRRRAGGHRRGARHHRPRAAQRRAAPERRAVPLQPRQHARGLPDRRLRLALPLPQRVRGAAEPPAARGAHRLHDHGGLSGDAGKRVLCRCCAAA